MITPPVRVHEPGATQRWGTRRRLDWRRELLLAAGLYGIYDLIRAEVSASDAWARRDGYDLLNWEQWAHLDPEHWLNHATLHLAVLTVPACYFYSALYMLLTPGTLIWVYRRHPHAYRQARTTLAMITFAALLAFRWFPTAPPRLLTGAGFADTLVYYKNWGWWGHETSLPSAAHALANQYAAMPSLHVAWATWCAATISVLTVRRSGRLLAWSYPIATALIVMATANHYLLDVLAGAVLWLVAHLAVRTAWRRSSQLPWNRLRSGRRGCPREAGWLRDAQADTRSSDSAAAPRDLSEEFEAPRRS